jgi:hypothetical protein
MDISTRPPGHMLLVFVDVDTVPCSSARSSDDRKAAAVALNWMLARLGRAEELTEAARRPFLIAVVGPSCAGKSTPVNALLEALSAPVDELRVIVDIPGLGRAEPDPGLARSGGPFFTPDTGMPSQLTEEEPASAGAWLGAPAAAGDPPWRQPAGLSGPGTWQAAAPGCSLTLTSPILLADGKGKPGHARGCPAARSGISVPSGLMWLFPALGLSASLADSRTVSPERRREDMNFSFIAAVLHSALAESGLAAARPVSRPAPGDGLLRYEPAGRAGPGTWQATTPWCHLPSRGSLGTAGGRREHARWPTAGGSAAPSCMARPRPAAARSSRALAFPVTGLPGERESGLLNGISRRGPMSAGELLRRGSAAWAGTGIRQAGLPGCHQLAAGELTGGMPGKTCRDRHPGARSASPVRHRRAPGRHNREREGCLMTREHSTFRDTRAGPGRYRSPCQHATDRRHSRLPVSFPSRLAFAGSK